MRGWLPQGRVEWGIVALATLLRLLWLDFKPPHFDEGINGWFCDRMTADGFYRYDPSNYHGPLHFYALWFSLNLGGRNLWALRLPVVLVGIASVLLALRFDRLLPRGACRWAAALLAVSPAMVFYHRYSIHEPWLMLFLMLGVWGLGVLWKEVSRAGLWAVAAAWAGMVCTKETWAIHAVAMALAAGCTWLWGKWVPATPLLRARAVFGWRDAAAAWGSAVAAVVILYSGTFLNPGGLEGLWTTYAKWARTGYGEEAAHAKVWYYWFELLWRYDQALLLGVAAALAAALPKCPLFLRWLAIQACGAFAAYSIIQYKTPWCLIAFAWPFAFTLGAILWWAGKRGWPRAAAAAGSALLLWGLWCSADLNYRRPTDGSHGYVYVQTYHDIAKVTRPLLEKAANDPGAYAMSGYIMAESYYPLPWVLGDFTAIAYWGSNAPREGGITADFVLADAEEAAAVEPRLTGPYFAENLTLRDGQKPSRFYMRYEAFRDVFPGRDPEVGRVP